MRKFSITSDHFEGEITIAYNEKGVINLVDTTDSEFTVKNMIRLFKILPKELGSDSNKTLNTFSVTSKLHIVEIFGDLSFKRFWDTYGHKVNRKRCLPLYEKLDDKSKSLAISRIAPYKRYLTWTKYRGIMDPEKWLRDQQFETEWHKLKR